MDPHKLLYLAAIIENGSLSKAAVQLKISQPALSKSMDRLEQELGIKLLDRGPRGIVPTASGDLIYTHACQIRDEMAMAEVRLQGAAHDGRVITIAVLPSLASYVIPLAVARWQSHHPDVVLKVIEKRQIELLWGLLRGDFDFVVGQTEFFDFTLDGLMQRVLFRDHLRIYARKDHDLFGHEYLTWSDLARYPWASPMVGRSQRTVIEKLMAAEGISELPQPIECGSVGFMKSLLANSNYLAMLPSHSLQAGTDKRLIKALPISAPELKRDIAVIFHERLRLDDVRQSLVTHIKEVGMDMS
ncbi:LysR family transcriptional regulator [Alcaligenaceae bacterium]|nr:LysR family transcriptional regulator [Alcaligenaceae bacterium]